MRAGDMREHNTVAVLRAVVHARGGISRAEISTALGLTRSTVSAIVDALLGAGLLTAGTPIAGGTGRPRVPLRPADVVAGLGAEISADRVRVVARSVSGHRLACRDAFADTPALPPAQVVALLADTVDAVRAELPRQTDVVGLTVSVPGRIGRDGRTVVSAPNLGWTDVPLADLLGAHERLAALSPVLANDSDLAARFEAISRPGESFVLIHGETGIGGAIVVDGRILRGETGWAGEIGHINIVPDGAPCGCGRRGCLEAYAGFHTLRRALDLPEGTHLDDLARALASPDARTRELVAEVGEHLGAVIAAVLNVLDLSTVVLSGYFRALAPQLAPSVRAVLRERALRPEAELVQSAGDGRQEADGAAREALEPFWRDVTGWIAARG
ncbi:Xylose-responsive transcription regulator, ROK family [Brachybacterium nesterenkovii]|uniref:Xylose-responsive transcription regulator, ROK family n=2 Tax=Brachybacterium nesterenkovii TaxID=47847 RepID=A0A1X6X6Q2_9MICO|nr:Xylose-responsive transcription regulator, ROK family [Brachybacterium nesterenkovii]